MQAKYEYEQSEANQTVTTTATFEEPHASAQASIAASFEEPHASAASPLRIPEVFAPNIDLSDSDEITFDELETFLLIRNRIPQHGPKRFDFCVQFYIPESEFASLEEPHASAVPDMNSINLNFTFEVERMKKAIKVNLIKVNMLNLLPQEIIDEIMMNYIEPITDYVYSQLEDAVKRIPFEYLKSYDINTVIPLNVMHLDPSFILKIVNIIDCYYRRYC